MKKNSDSFRKKIFTKENVAFMSIALILCFGVVVSKLNSSDIPLHDGDVLVDSKNVSAEENEKNKSLDFTEEIL